MLKCCINIYLTPIPVIFSVPAFDTTTANAKAVRLGNWERAENYTTNIIEVH
jgi:hypothetical protein